MATITLKGNTIHTIGDLPRVGDKAPEFRLTKGDLGDASLADWKGMVRILNIVPSLDTGVCAASARAFNTKVQKLGQTVVLIVSRDLPFAQKRFCEVEGLSAIIPLSEMRDRGFGDGYGVTILDGPLAGLLSRAVVVVDPSGRIVYTEQVPEIGQEPNYDAALAAAEKAKGAGY